MTAAEELNSARQLINTLHCEILRLKAREQSYISRVAYLENKIKSDSVQKQSSTIISNTLSLGRPCGEQQQQQQWDVSQNSLPGACMNSAMRNLPQTHFNENCHSVDVSNAHQSLVPTIPLMMETDQCEKIKNKNDSNQDVVLKCLNVIKNVNQKVSSVREQKCRSPAESELHSSSSSDSEVTCVVRCASRSEKEYDISDDVLCNISISQRVRSTTPDPDPDPPPDHIADSYLQDLLTCTPPSLAKLLLQKPSDCLTPESDRTTISTILQSKQIDTSKEIIIKSSLRTTKSKPSVQGRELSTTVDEEKDRRKHSRYSKLLPSDNEPTSTNCTPESDRTTISTVLQNKIDNSNVGSYGKQTDTSKEIIIKSSLRTTKSKPSIQGRELSTTVDEEKDRRKHSRCSEKTKLKPTKGIKKLKTEKKSKELSQKEDVSDQDSCSSLFPQPIHQHARNSADVGDWFSEKSMTAVSAVVNSCLNIQRKKSIINDSSNKVILSPIKRSRGTAVESVENKTDLQFSNKNNELQLISVSQIIRENEIIKKEEPFIKVSLPPVGSVISVEPMPIKSRGTPVRKQSERKALTAITCGVCKLFIDALDIPEKQKIDHLQQHGRHRCECPPSCTPPGFWDQDVFM